MKKINRKLISIRMLSSLLVLTLPLGQATAFAQTLGEEIQSVNMNPVDSIAMNSDMQNAADTIDQNMSDFQKMDQEAAQADAASSMSEKAVRKASRWEKILTKRIPKIEESLNKSVDRMTDKQVGNAIDTVKGKAEKSSNPSALDNFNKAFSNSSLSQREQLKAAYIAALPKTIQIAANQIGIAGGAIPFLLHAKSEMKKIAAEGAQASRNQKRMTRMPADLCGVDGLPVALVALSIIVGPALIFGGSLLPIGVAIASVLTVSCLVAAIVIAVDQQNNC